MPAQPDRAGQASPTAPNPPRRKHGCAARTHRSVLGSLQLHFSRLRLLLLLLPFLVAAQCGGGGARELGQHGAGLATPRREPLGFPTSSRTWAALLAVPPGGLRARQSCGMRRPRHRPWTSHWDRRLRASRAWRSWRPCAADFSPSGARPGQGPSLHGKHAPQVLQELEQPQMRASLRA